MFSRRMIGSPLQEVEQLIRDKAGMSEAARLRGQPAIVLTRQPV